MPAINWVFLCDYAFVDAAGKASIIGVFENVRTKALPIKIPQMYVILGFSLNPGESCTLSSKLTSPTGKEMSEVKPVNIVAPSNAPNFGKNIFSFGFYGIQFTETGEHRLEIFVDNNSIHSIPLHVIIQQKN